LAFLGVYVQQQFLFEMTDRLFCEINLYNNQLKSKLNQSQTDGAQLMEEVVAEVVGASSQVLRVAYMNLLALLCG